VGVFTDDPALVEDALVDAGASSVPEFEVYLSFWGTSAGAGTAFGVAQVAATAGSVAPFVWGGPNDPGGAMGGIGQALFNPSSPYQAYWSGSQNFINWFGRSMVYNAAGGVVLHVAGEVLGNAIDAYFGTEEALVPDGALSVDQSPTQYVYRGVKAGHPALEAAKEGTAIPGDADGLVTAAEHNAGGYSAESPYTSWSTNESTARWFANSNGPGGVVLRAPYEPPPPGATWSWEASPDLFNEGEILLRGVRTGLEVIP